MKGPQVSIFVLIDALGWPYVEQHGFLNDLLPFRRPIHTVLGFSSGAIPTILTGVPPADHGHWNLFYYDPAGSPFWWMRYFRWLPGRMLDNRYTRKIMQQLGRRVLGLGRLFECAVSPGLLPWFNWVEKKCIFERGGIVGAPSIFDELAQRGVPSRVYSYHQATDEQILERAKADVRSGAASFFFLYLSEMDLFLHYNCDQPQRVQERMDWYAKQLRELMEVARQVDPSATMTVTSDHGMTPVSHKYDLVGDVEKLGLRMPEDYVAVYDSTMARYWFFNDRAREQITRALQSAPCGRLLEREELDRFGVLFPDGRFGEAILLLHPGWLLARSDFNGPGWMPAGMHGYHPEDRYSDAIFLSSEQPPCDVRTIADVHACMQEAAGIVPRAEMPAD